MTVEPAPGYLSWEDRPVIVHRTFPAVVSLTGEVTLTPAPTAALVIVTRAFVYCWTAPGEPLFYGEHHDVDLRGTFDPPDRPSVVRCGESVVSWVPGEGCQCSHPLKTFRPFSPTRLG